jgi:protein-S-isoprenylcysteine O-methyltransferase Ste14
MNTGRGGRWVAVQLLLLIGIFLVPGQYLPDGLAQIMTIAGLIVGCIGLMIVAVAWGGLGRNLSVFPKPIDDGQLVQTGIYGLVRHPMYTGVILTALGWALFRTSLIALVLVVVLIVFFDRKAAQEERLLSEKYPDYEAYRARTRHKLIPFLY